MPVEIKMIHFTIVCYPIGLTILDVELRKDLLMLTPNRKQEKRTKLLWYVQFRLPHPDASTFDTILNIYYRSNETFGQGDFWAS